jgi:predicted metalloprotease with PDZ domain
MDFRVDPDDNLKGHHPIKLGVSFGHPRSQDNVFGTVSHQGCIQIYDVMNYGPAKQAGMRKWDIIIEVGGIPIQKLPGADKDPVCAFSQYLKSRQAGKFLHVRVIREDKELDLYLDL